MGRIRRYTNAEQMVSRQHTIANTSRRQLQALRKVADKNLQTEFVDWRGQHYDLKGGQVAVGDEIPKRNGQIAGRVRRNELSEKGEKSQFQIRQESAMP